MVKVRGENVHALREHQRLSERQTAIRVAARLNENPGSWRHAIRRIERREVQELDADEAEALAEELGVEVETLGEELLWTWTTDTGLPWEIGTKALAFTNPGDAFDKRDWLALVTRGKYPTNVIRVVPRRRRDLLAQLGENINDPKGRLAAAMLIVDPDESEFAAVGSLEFALQEKVPMPEEARRLVDVQVNLGLAATIMARHVGVIGAVYKEDSPEFQRALRRFRVLHELAQRTLDDLGAAIAEADELSEPDEMVNAP